MSIATSTRGCPSTHLRTLLQIGMAGIGEEASCCLCNAFALQTSHLDHAGRPSRYALNPIYMANILQNLHTQGIDSQPHSRRATHGRVSFSPKVERERQNLLRPSLIKMDYTILCGRPRQLRVYITLNTHRHVLDKWLRYVYIYTWRPTHSAQWLYYSHKAICDYIAIFHNSISAHQKSTLSEAF